MSRAPHVLCSLVAFAAGACCPLDLAVAAAGGVVGREVNAQAQAKARSRELLQEAEDAKGRDDWPCPPRCAVGYLCVHSALVDHGICRPRCDLEADRCDRPARCTPVTGAEPACVDAAMVGTHRPQVEPVAPPPPLLDP